MKRQQQHQSCRISLVFTSSWANNALKDFIAFSWKFQEHVSSVRLKCWILRWNLLIWWNCERKFVELFMNFVMSAHSTYSTYIYQRNFWKLSKKKFPHQMFIAHVHHKANIGFDLTSIWYVINISLMLQWLFLLQSFDVKSPVFF